MPKFTILLMPFVLVGVLETVDWAHHLARQPHASQLSEVEKVVAEAPAEIAPRRESLEQPH
jgi:hypothetical protein